MQAYRLVFLAGLLGMALSLSACDVSTPSQIQTGKIRVKEQMVTEALDAGHIDQARVSVISRDILRNGKGEVSLTVPYLSGGEYSAREISTSYQEAFQTQGVRHVSVALVPVTERQYADKAVLAYRAMTAIPASDCTRIPGYQGTDNIEELDRYRIGCETQAATARMVVDPTDMLGKAGTQDRDSRRSGAIIEPYSSGVPNQPLKGMQASKVGQ